MKVKIFLDVHIFLHLHSHETSLFCFLHKPGETEILPPHVQRDKQSDLQSVVYSVSREGICRHPNGKGLWLISVCWRDLCQLWGSSDVLTIRSGENPRSTLSVISSMEKLRQWLQETNSNSHISTQWWYDSLFSYFCFVSIKLARTISDSKRRYKWHWCGEALGE